MIQKILGYLIHKFTRKRHPYEWLIMLMGLSAGLMIGLQLGTIKRQFKQKEESFEIQVKKAVSEVQQYYMQLVSHVSNEQDTKSFNQLFYNQDSTFALMTAHSVQPYPLLDFKEDTLLPKIRNEQFQQFKEILLNSRTQNPQVKEFYIFRAIQYCKDCEEDKRSIAEIFPLDSLLRVKLKKYEIETEVALSFYNISKKQYSYLPDSLHLVSFDESKFQFDFTNQEQIRFHFPHYTSVLLYQLLAPIIASLGLITLSLLTFGISLRIILRQRKLSCLKNDFINNISHEFKTPIATIAFAVANVENEKVIHSPEKIKQFTKVIKDENKRLNAQVEKVLQAAITEEKALELKRESINLHQLINDLVDAYDLKLPEHSFIQRRLNAGQANIEGDYFHLSNALSNLLDNAIKYSKENEDVQISISTEDTQEGVLIRVMDKGVGIKKENQKMIFDKFYRVSSGNLHNVKGFGLGLSYVKEIISKHQGSISLQSKWQIGSTFSIFLPISKNYNYEKNTLSRR